MNAKAKVVAYYSPLTDHVVRSQPNSVYIPLVPESALTELRTDYQQLHRVGVQMAKDYEVVSGRLVSLLTDHEAALAALCAGKDDAMRQYVEEVSAQILDLDRKHNDALNQLTTLLTQHNVLLAGLEALAGELDLQKFNYAAGRIRTLASSATGEKNTEEERK